MTVARLLGTEEIEVRANSQVVVSQVLGQFPMKGERLKKYLQLIEIKVKYFSPRHPQANEQADATNKTLLSTLKKKIGAHKGSWTEELLSVLWAYRATVRTLTGETPFALTYDSETVILVEVGMPTFRVQHFNPDANNERLAESLDVLEERREEAMM
ncbi:uncharacterized protein LOC121249413 [Juglans microcarpa x Juglans regia]|uniref:uncharacterized protein LOC121249413 n=1 Tax=Juglans microcarpa x Juglans regia TaxID=2249226 RepID=UPI001B7DF871|nr:uncharacterized protein LOC121249413 [Juglans microcarpa x Juglans regia]